MSVLYGSIMSKLDLFWHRSEQIGVGRNVSIKEAILHAIIISLSLPIRLETILLFEKVSVLGKFSSSRECFFLKTIFSTCKFSCFSSRFKMKSFVAVLLFLGCALALASADTCPFPHPGNGGVLTPTGDYIPSKWMDFIVH